MRLFDSNIIIYSSKPEFASLNLSLRITADDAFLLAISAVEVLGFSDLTDTDRQFHENQFATANGLPLDDVVIKRTIELRRIKRRMSLGDALIAATALEFEHILVTNNVADFAGIANLRIENPLAATP